ncbi:hypothetical protein CEXT_244961 [Caerostris extrusa]|uniref:Uncharacterized protein n=1 Tax=Caerostris extrusa TaxID=172846 RepID=A0AAV4V303_CAEEX|nr:hypothetical protein CEXT_244961 [Caerostris extrusa]
MRKWNWKTIFPETMGKPIHADRIAATIHHRLSEDRFILLRRHFYFAIFFQLMVYAGVDGAERRFRAGRRYYFSSSVISIAFISKDVVGQLIDGMAQERLFADNAPRKKANGRRNILL